MSRFCFCNCPAGFSADPERHAPDCPGRSGAGKARTPVPATTPALTVNAAEELDAVLHWRTKHAQAIKERDGLQISLNTADQSIDELNAAISRRTHRVRELEALLTASDEREDVLEAEVERLNRVKLALKELVDSRADNCSVYRQHLTVGLAFAEKVRDASLGMQRKYLADLIDYLRQNGASLKPAEGGGDEV